MVKNFHLALGAPIGDLSAPALLDGVFRAELICEESLEFAEAVYQDDLVEAIDGLCDLLYVAYGAAVTFGVNLAPFWNEVHASSMAKLGGGVREDGKFLKPEGWQPPDIAGILAGRGGAY